MKCEQCNKELEETLIFDGIEYRKITKEDITFDKIIIPKGWKLPTITESITIFETEKIWNFVKDNNTWWWTSEKIRGWPVGCGDNGGYINFNLNADSNRRASRGVLICRGKK